MAGPPLLRAEDESAGAVTNPFKAKNVRLCLYLQFMLMLIWSFSFGATFDSYLLELARVQGRGDPNSFVGLVESVRGMVGLVLALPLGVLADKFNRRHIMGLGCIFGTVGVSLLALGVAMDSVPVIYSGVIVAAIFMQSYMSCGSALLADSVPKERLTEVIAWQGSLMLLGVSAGPVLQIALISCVGDVWRLHELHVFICAGFALWPLVIPAFFMFERTMTELEVPAAGAAGAGSPLGSDNGSEDLHWGQQMIFGVKKKWLVPIIIEFCSLITALGAGMTVKFFPLFFKEDYHFSPIALNSLNACYTVCIAVFVQLCRKLSAKVGRVAASLTWQVCGTACLFCLWKAQPLPLVVALYIIRGSLMNAAGPINQAIIMECVDTKYRGRWSALQSISRFSWSGSAILGGWLADSHDYRYTFYITALMYSCSVALSSPLLLLVPGKQDAASSAGRTGTSARRAVASSNGASMVSIQPGDAERKHRDTQA